MMYLTGRARANEHPPPNPAAPQSLARPARTRILSSHHAQMAHEQGPQEGPRHGTNGGWERFAGHCIYCGRSTRYGDDRHDISWQAELLESEDRYGSV